MSALQLFVTAGTILAGSGLLGLVPESEAIEKRDLRKQLIGE